MASAGKTQPFAEHEIISKSGETVKLRVEYGDFSADLGKVNDALTEVSRSEIRNILTGLLLFFFLR